MACGTSLSTGLTVDCMDGVGGLKKIYFALKRNIASITQANQAVTAITMESGGLFYDFAVDQEKANATSAMTKNVANGTTPWVHTIGSTWRKLSSEKSNLIKILALQPGIVAIVEDNNGNFLMMGYNLGGHLATANGATGIAIGDANGYDFTFTANDKHDWYYVNSSIVPALISPTS